MKTTIKQNIYTSRALHEEERLLKYLPEDRLKTFAIFLHGDKLQVIGCDQDVKQQIVKTKGAAEQMPF